MKTSRAEKGFKMKKEYDFSHAMRGRFFQPRKIQKTIRLDEDALIFLQRVAAERKIGYQTLLNEVIRKAMNADSRKHRS